MISEKLDFYGLNYYAPSKIAAGSGAPATPDGASAAMASLPFHLEAWPEFPVTGFGWPIAPEFLGTALDELATRYGDVLPPVVITENGASFADAVTLDPDDGTPRVHDGARIDYLAAHLDAAVRAVGGGGAASVIDLRGYYVWSLLDNFEWAAGYTQRFGLVHVDFDDFTRTPKDSYHWLRRVAESR